MRGTKALLAAVIVMGVAILLGIAVLISVVVHRALRAVPPAPASIAAVDLALALGQPPGTRIAAVTRQSDALLAVTLADGGVPDRVLIWSFATKRIVATLSVSR